MYFTTVTSILRTGETEKERERERNCFPGFFPKQLNLQEEGIVDGRQSERIRYKFIFTETSQLDQ